MESARFVLSDVGENNPLIQSCQRDLGHQLPLSSYLLKPVQRLTKYQLILKQLSESSVNALTGKFELEESVEVILGVIKTVNDSLHQPNIKGLPEELFPLGTLIHQETFIVLTENKSQSQILFRNSKQRRQVLLYDNYLVFCKAVTQKTRTSYHFKFCLALANLGMSSIIKDEEKKMEIWISGQSEVYRLEAKTKQVKEEFASELKKWILKAKKNPSNRTARMPPSVHNENLPSRSGSETRQSFRPNFNRSKSLDHEEEKRTHQSHSCGGYPNRSSSETQLADQSHMNYTKYQVLADYVALSERELSLHELDIVELVKTGCAGWWYVRMSLHPFTEGWAPSTYLNKLEERN